LWSECRLFASAVCFLAVTTLAFAVTTGDLLPQRDLLRVARPEAGGRIARPVLFGKFDLDSSEYAYY